MRQLLTIFHYELLMQLKSIRFKATCLLAGLIAFGFYSDGVRNQEIPNPQRYLLDFGTFPLYVIAIAFTGLFAIGRIRSTGMHPILMTKPFPTFALLLGQLLAALAALLVPLLILLFPGGLALHWQYGLDFSCLPLLHVILFFMIPLACCVLAVTLWVRTCFKNNLVAIIVLTLIFAATTVAGNKYLTTTTRGDDGRPVTIHRFVPLASYFCQDYWQGRMKVLEQPQVSFTNGSDWINWATSILYCNVFLMLGGYHLRRTEPQRKVMGTYGRRWYHAPTFLKMACDLKVDPNVTWRHHLLLAGMIGVILLRTVWPMMPQNFGARAGAARGADRKKDELDPNRFPENRILAVKEYDDTQLMTPERFTEEMTVSIKGETSGTMAILARLLRTQYDLRAITMDGRSLPYRSDDSHIFIDGGALKPFTDHGKHKFRIDAVHSTTQDMNGADNPAERVYICGYRFIHSKAHYLSSEGELMSSFAVAGGWRYPIRFSLEKPAGDQLLFSRIQPKVIKNRNVTRYDIEITTQTKSMDQFLYFARGDSYAVLEAAAPKVNLRLGMPRPYRQVAAELLELAQPVLEDYCKLHDISTTTSVFFLSPQDQFDAVTYDRKEQLFKDIRKYQNIYRYRGYFYNYGGRDEKGEYLKSLAFFEKCLLQTLTMWDSGYSHWDLDNFTMANALKGLNHRLVPGQKYEPPEYAPKNAHLDAKQAPTLQRMTRQDCLIYKDRWPVFQMLYLVLGHEKYQALLHRLRDLPAQDDKPIDTLQSCAEAAAGEKMDWFFDYWMRTGRDFPAYQIVSATGKLDPAGDDNKTQYTVRTVIKNLGTGRMPVPVRLETNKTVIDGKIWIGGGETVTWTQTCRELPKTVAVDPDGWIMTQPYWVEKNKVWITAAQEEVKMQ